MKWNSYDRRWELQQAPTTSSSWDRLASSRWKLTLRIWWWFAGRNKRAMDAQDERNKTVYLPESQ